MHVYFFLRGIKHEMELTEKFLQTQMFPFKRKRLSTGKHEVAMAQGALREIKLYEYVFPEESLDEVCTMLKLGSPDEKGEVKVGKPEASLRPMIYGIRKMLGAKALKKHKSVPTTKYIHRNGVALTMIGVKKDKRAEVKDWDYEQELL